MVRDNDTNWQFLWEMFDENKHADIYAHKMISRRSKVTLITYESNGYKSIHLEFTSNLKIVFGLKIYTVLKNKQEEEKKIHWTLGV